MIGLDLGSARVGFVRAPPHLPLRVQHRGHPDVMPQALAATVDGIVEAVEAFGERDLVVEHGSYYPMPEKGPAANKAMADAHEVCSILLAGIRAALPGPWYWIHVIARNTWAHRVVPHTRGGITEAMANAGLCVHVEPACWGALATQDERDAAGALVGFLLPAPRKALARYRFRDRRKDKSQPRPEPLSPEAREAIRRARWAETAPRRRALTLARVRKHRGALARLTGAVCNCGPGGAPKVTGGRHKGGCRRAPLSAVRGSAEAAAAYVPMTRPDLDGLRLADAPPPDALRDAVLQHCQRRGYPPPAWL